MKPKKRQPLDFSALPVEPPIEDTARAPNVDSDAPISELDLDLDIADVPSADEMTLRGPLPAELPPETDPPPFPPRAQARRSLFQRPPEPDHAESRREPEPSSEPEPQPARPQGRSTRTVEPDPGPPPSFLTPSAAQPPAPVAEPEPPARTESTAATLRDPPAQPLSMPLVTERKPMPAALYWTLAVAAAGLWALAPIAFALGYGAGIPALKVDQFAMAVFAAMAIGPAIFTIGPREESVT